MKSLKRNTIHILFHLVILTHSVLIEIFEIILIIYFVLILTMFICLDVFHLFYLKMFDDLVFKNIFKYILLYFFI